MLYTFFLFVLLTGNIYCLSDKQLSVDLSSYPSSSSPSSNRPSSSRPSSSRPSSSSPSSSSPSSNRPSSSAPTRIVNLYYYNLHDTYHNFTVPVGITRLDIKSYGAQGGNGNDPLFMNNGDIIPGIPGKGGYVNAKITVVPNQKLYIFVGKQGGDSSLVESNGIGKGGFNGGGDGYNAGGGGGSSDIRSSLASYSRLVVAGGGGGASQQSNGGVGGASNSRSGKGGGNQCGFGGTQIMGGLRGATFYLNSDYCPIESCTYNTDGEVYYGGSGGFQAQGGGGGGYYGGGAGGTWGGGGGGSNYVNSQKATLISQSAGIQSGNGLIIISYFL